MRHTAIPNEPDPVSAVDDVLARLPRALDAVSPHTVRTPVVELTLPDGSASVLVKCEHLQVTGSFKARGALAKLTAMGAEARRRGLVTASSGNHGLGVANALSVLGGHGLVCVPESASPVKVAAIRRLGVSVRHLGSEGVLPRRWLGRWRGAGPRLRQPGQRPRRRLRSGRTVGPELLEQTRRRL